MLQYRKGYKYQLAVNYDILTPVDAGVEVDSEFYKLHVGGLLLIRAGYAWDGASGPTFDTAASIRPSMVHDCFCQMMRAGEIDFQLWHETVNKFFQQLCCEAGMWKWRALLWYWGVTVGNAGNPSQGADNKIWVAP